MHHDIAFKEPYNGSLGTSNRLTRTRTPQGASNIAYSHQEWQLSPVSRLKERELRSSAWWHWIWAHGGGNSLAEETLSLSDWSNGLSITTL